MRRWKMDYDDAETPEQEVVGVSTRIGEPYNQHGMLFSLFLEPYKTKIES